MIPPLRKPFSVTLAAALLAAAPLPLPAQDAGPAPAPSERTTTVAAGPEYGAGAVREFLLGKDYRNLWTTPVRVPVLDLGSFAGGLKPLKRGGSLQTKNLRLLGADGKEYAFRSVNKDPLLAQTPDLKGTAVGHVIYDQNSSLFPASALVVPPLLEAVGVLHVVPTLYVMPDDPRLGEFRTEFAGVLGMLEARPDEGESEDVTFFGTNRLISTERLLERLAEDQEERIDSRAYLTARLMDLWLGDWDRHADQWRWAGYKQGGDWLWKPIPRDRDYVFSDYDGLVPRAGSRLVPNIVTFDAKYASLQGLTFNAHALDRQLLSDLPRAAWDSAAAFVAARLTDDRIASALRRLPPEYHAQAAPELQRLLQARRDQLPGVVRRWYQWLAEDADVFGTDDPDLAVVDRHADGSLTVRLFPDADKPTAGRGAPFYQRRFTPAETQEVRVYLRGGNDRAVVRGSGWKSVTVRVVGGAGNDVLADSARVQGGGGTAFYDHEGENRFVRGRDTQVSTRGFALPEGDDPLTGQGYRDWGSTRGFAGWIDYGGTRGLVLGGGPSFTNYGFQQVPYASRVTLRGAYSFKLQRFAADLSGDFRRANSPWSAGFYALASQIEAMRFYGFGNETGAARASDHYLVRQDQVMANAALSYYLDPRSRLSAGPVLKYTDSSPEDGSPFALLGGERGSGHYGQLGAFADGVLDRRDNRLFPRRGVRARFGAAAYPAVWDVAEPFAEIHGDVSTYLSLPGGRGPVLALRAGGKQVWGDDFPVHEAAFLGGWSSVRGYTSERFAGDAMLFGNAELRQRLARVKLLVRGDLGVLALADAGRVWFEDESSSDWHTGHGAGVWFTFRFKEAPITSSFLWARGETDRYTVRLGVPF